MKSILVIVAHYSPDPSSVASCLHPLLQELSKAYSIDILTDRKRLEDSSYEKCENLAIHRIENFRLMAVNKLNDLKKINFTRFTKLFTRFFILALKTLYYLRYDLFAREQGSGGWTVKRAYQKYLELNDQHPYDMVISASLPFQSHFIAEKIKKNRGDSILWHAFEFDPYAYNDSIVVNRFRRRQMRKSEANLFDRCDHLWLTLELFNFYQATSSFRLSPKVTPLPYANLVPIELSPIKKCHNYVQGKEISCLFIGSFYHDIRNPGKLLDLFSKVDSDIKLFLMTNFSEEEIQEISPADYTPNVIPLQSRDSALYNLMQADILVNVGNNVESQIPGKLFEYMSTGKPIIHFSKIDNDPALPYLARYPKALVINEWSPDFTDYVSLLEAYCRENRGVELPFEDIVQAMGEFAGEEVITRFHRTIENEITHLHDDNSQAT